MTDLEALLAPPTLLSPHDWESLRKDLLRVRWPGSDNVSSNFAFAQGKIHGLRMARALDWTANHRLYALLSNALTYAYAEANQRASQAA